MKIVIDIHEETYKRIQAMVNANYFEHDIFGYSMQRIANGTVLPKGHGRLIDADLLLNYKVGGAWFDPEYVRVKYIYKAPTIIEADKEKDNDE